MAAPSAWTTTAGAAGAGPTPRQCHAVAALADGTVYLFGGYHEQPLNDLFSYELASKRWAAVTARTGQAPAPRHSPCVVGFGTHLVVWGGIGLCNELLGDLSVFDAASRSWSCPATMGVAPSPRWGASAVVVDGMAYVFGGLTAVGYSAEVFALNLTTYAWECVTATGAGPSPRFYAAAALSSDNTMVVHGGAADGGRVFADAFAFSPTARTWTALTVATATDNPPRRGHVAICVGRSLYLLGGATANRLDSPPVAGLAALALDSRTWSRDLPAVSLEPRAFAAAAAVGATLVVTCGFTGAANSSAVDELTLPGAVPVAAMPAPPAAAATLQPPTPTTTGASKSGAIKLKCDFGGEIRLMPFPADCTFHSLQEALDAQYASAVDVAWRDEEGDLIVIRNQKDLDYCLASQLAVSRGSIKLYLERTRTLTAQGSTAAAPPRGGAATTATAPAAAAAGNAAAAAAAAGTTQSGVATAGRTAGRATPLVPPAAVVVPGASAPYASASASAPRVNWKKGRLLGAGGFGKVYEGLNQDTGEMMAVKVITLEETTLSAKEAELQEVETEIRLLRSLHHRHIVRYIGVERAPNEDGQNCLNIFLEYVPGGSLSGLLAKIGAVSERVCQVYIRQILRGLEYLHSQEIVHRDIKGANILVASGEQTVLKLTDFGASKTLSEESSAAAAANSFKGTPYFMAPEVVKQQPYRKKVDIWSVGCVVIELLTCKPPWHQYTAVTALFKIGNSTEMPEFPPALSPQGRDFLAACFRRDPDTRPSAAELLSHAWLAELPDDAAAGAAAANPAPPPSAAARAAGPSGGGGGGAGYTAGSPPAATPPAVHNAFGHLTPTSPHSFAPGFGAGGGGGGGARGVPSAVDTYSLSLAEPDDITPLEFWRRYLGTPDAAGVSFSNFVHALSTYLGASRIITGEDEEYLHALLPIEQAGSVVTLRFLEDFLKWFGPLPRCVNNASLLMRQEWFHGFLDKDATLRLLSGQPPKTFLVRISETTPGGFVVAYVNEVMQVVQSKVYTTEGGVTADQGKTQFANLPDLVVAYSVKLQFAKPRAAPQMGYAQVIL